MKHLLLIVAVFILVASLCLAGDVQTRDTSQTTDTTQTTTRVTAPTVQLPAYIKYRFIRINSSGYVIADSTYNSTNVKFSLHGVRIKKTGFLYRRKAAKTFPAYFYIPKATLDKYSGQSVMPSYAYKDWGKTLINSSLISAGYFVAK
ncbi:hypothetical protein ACFL56_02130 [Candidatus Margulisiibacteriota bacterium]